MSLSAEAGGEDTARAQPSRSMDEEGRQRTGQVEMAARECRQRESQEREEESREESYGSFIIVVPGRELGWIGGRRAAGIPSRREDDDR